MILNCAKCGRFTNGKHAIPIRDAVHPYTADYDYLCSRCAAEQESEE